MDLFLQFCRGQKERLRNLSGFSRHAAGAVIDMIRLAAVVVAGFFCTLSGDPGFQQGVIWISLIILAAGEIFIRICRYQVTVFSYFLCTLVILAQIAGAYVTSALFMPLYRTSVLESISIYSGYNLDKDDIQYVYEFLDPICKTLENEYGTRPPPVSVLVTRNNTEFESMQVWSAVYSPVFSVENTIIMAPPKTHGFPLDFAHESRHDTREGRIRYYLMHEMSHMFFNNYSMNRDRFLSEGLARYFTCKKYGIDELDSSYEAFLVNWKRVFQGENIKTDSANIPLVIYDYIRDEAFNDPQFRKISGHFAYNLMNWLAYTYTPQAVKELILDLGKARKTDEILFRITGYDLKGAIWHSITDDWYLKHLVKQALSATVPENDDDYSLFRVFVNGTGEQARVPGDFKMQELVEWLNINIPLQSEILVADAGPRTVLHIRSGKIIFPEKDAAER